MKKPPAHECAQQIEQQLFASVADNLEALNGRLNQRLVATFFRMLMALRIHPQRQEFGFLLGKT